MIPERVKRTALALAYGVMMQGGLISGIPGGIPGLSKAISCTSCTMKLNKSGVPSQFSMYMTDEQKKKFKSAIKRG